MKKIILILTLCLVGSCYIGWKLHLNATQTSLSPDKTLENHHLTHLGIIMDGNRRWARRLGLAPWLGHRSGVEPVKRTIKFCLEHKIPYLTLYAFSLENFKRPQQELDFLFNTLAQEIASNELNELLKQGVCVRFVGDRKLFPDQLLPVINDIEEKTRKASKLTLSILFCYGGQQEIINAVRMIARAVQEGMLKPEDITPRIFEEQLWTANIPPCDLIIRTGRMKRLSNFLPYQSAYSELCFLDCYWPEITEEDLKQAIVTFANRTRTFGR